MGELNDLKESVVWGKEQGYRPVVNSGERAIFLYEQMDSQLRELQDLAAAQQDHLREGSRCLHEQQARKIILGGINLLELSIVYQSDLAAHAEQLLLHNYKRWRESLGQPLIHKPLDDEGDASC